jgi:hypothetical protein
MTDAPGGRTVKRRERRAPALERDLQVASTHGLTKALEDSGMSQGEVWETVEHVPAEPTFTAPSRKLSRIGR